VGLSGNEGLVRAAMEEDDEDCSNFAKALVAAAGDDWTAVNLSEDK